MSFSNSGTMDQIDQEITALKERIRNLRTARNHLAPVSRLPAELFAEIFFRARSNLNQRPSVHVILTITWVCRHWRDIALAIPGLWTYLNFTQPDKVQAFLDRSMGAKLAIILPKNITLKNPVLPLIWPVLSRTENLSLRFPDGRCYALAASQWMTPAPVLKRLSLKNIILQKDLFGGDCPVLSVKSAYCDRVWTAGGIFPNLTSLYIYRPYTSGTTLEVLELLRVLPQLQDLRLSGALMERVSSLPPVEPIILPCLQSVKIVDEDCAAVHALLQPLVFPETALIEFSSILVYIITHPANILKSLNACRKTAPRKVVTLNIDFRDFYRLKITEAPPDGHGDPEIPNISLSFNMALSQEQFSDMIRFSLEALDLTHLHSLDIWVEHIQPLGFLWSQIFGPLTELRTLRTYTACARSLVQHLWIEGRESLIEQSYTPKSLCALQTLSIEGLDHRPPYTSLDQLQRVLANRSQFAGRLQELAITGLKLPVRIVNGFRVVVDRLVMKESLMPRFDRTRYVETDGEDSE